MAVPTVVGTGAASAGTGDITPALPAGIQADDILVLFVESAYGEAVSAPSGWEAAPNSPIESSGGGTRLSVFWKRAGGSESAPTVTDPGDHVIGAIIAFRGVVADKFPFLNTVSGTTAASTSKSLTIAPTQGIADAMYVAAISSGIDGQTTGRFTSWSSTALTSETERIDAFTDLGTGGGIGVATGERLAAVYSTSASISVTNSSDSTSSPYWTAGLIPDTAVYPIVRGAGAAANGTAAITLTIPDGVRENDILVAFLETANQDITISGWTQAGSSPASNTSGNVTRATVFWKRAGASESSVTTSDSGLHQEGFILAVVGAPTSGDPFNVTSNTTSGSGTSVTIGGATTTAGNCLVLNAVASTGSATFASWANGDLSEVTQARNANYSNGVSLFGSIGVMHGRKATAGAYGSTTVTLSGSGTSGSWAGWTGAIGTAGQTLSAEPGTLTVSSQNAQFNWLFADAGTLSMAGEAANINQSVLLSADAGTLSVASGDANLPVGYALKADSSNLTATPYEARILYDIKLQAEPGAIQFFGGEADILGSSPETFSLSFIVDMLPPDAGGTYQRYTERLTVDGTELKVRSWTYEESASSIAGSLQIQLADVSQRSLVTASSQIVFDLGEWTGTDWRWTSLLDTGRLRNSQYSISRQGIGPDDSFTFTAMSEMEDLLGTAPDNNEVWYDPLRHEITSDDVEGIYDLAGNYYPPTIVSISGMTLYGIMQRIFVTECGFADFATNIPDFRVPMVEFSAGQSYAAALSGIIGMFEPTYTWTGTGASLVISVNDGTTGAASGIPSARTVTTSRATSLGVADELDKVRALIMSVNQQRYSFDYWSERNEVTSTDIGNLDLYPGEYVTTQTTTTYRDYFHDSNPDRAVKTEVRRITTESFLGGTELVKETNENFYYDSWGRLYLRSKSVDAKVPNPASSFALSLIPVFEETERLSYRVHPYRPGQYYRSKREVSSAGLVYIDGDNQQLGEDYVRDAVSVYRAGNVTDAMTSDWRKLKTFVERQKPMRNGKVEIKTTEYDYLAKQFTIDELKEEDGQVGVNAFVNEQRRIVVYEPGQTSVTGQTMSVNMGELPLSTATALAQRLLRRRLYATERVELSLAGIDPTIQRGMTLNPRGRAGADLGTFTVEARTMAGSQQGYTMSLQARSAATS